MISYYLNEILMPKLKNFGVSQSFCNYTVEIVEQQITSLIKHWDDIAFRKSILLIGMEEGVFYEPSAKTDIKAFVVMTIRNSPIETMQSDLYLETGLNSPLTNEQIKSITSDAIRYFNTQNFSDFCMLTKRTIQDDYYYQILNNHPVVKNALEKLSGTTAKSVTYKPVEFSNPCRLNELEAHSKVENLDTKMSTVVLDGYSTEFDPELCKILQTFAYEKQGVFRK